MKSDLRNKISMNALRKYYLIQLAFIPLAHNLFAQAPPTLGNYPDTTVVVSANTTVTPTPLRPARQVLMSRLIAISKAFWSLTR